MSKEDFIRLVTADQPEAPAYFLHDAMLNRQERTQPRRVAETVSASADAGSNAAVAERRGSGGRRALGRRVRRRAFAGQREYRLARQLRDLGRNRAQSGKPDRPDRRSGRRAGSCHASRAHRFRPCRRVSARRNGRVGRARGTAAQREQITADGLAVELSCETPPLVLDVRAPSEREAGSLRDSVHIPLNRLADRLDELPRDRRLIVHCGRLSLGDRRQPAQAGRLRKRSRTGGRLCRLGTGPTAHEHMFVRFSERFIP